MSLDYQLIGRRIRMYRKQKNISQFALAERIDKSPTFISNLETGVKGTSLETLVAIANSLGVTTDSLLADHLTNNTVLLENEYGAMLDGCSDYEKRILIANTQSLKRILKENRGPQQK